MCAMCVDFEDRGSDDHMGCVAGLRGSQMINAWKDRQQSQAGGEIASILNNDMIEALLSDPTQFTKSTSLLNDASKIDNRK